jgi:hypothetical protein
VEVACAVLLVSFLVAWRQGTRQTHAGRQAGPRWSFHCFVLDHTGGELAISK